MSRTSLMAALSAAAFSLSTAAASVSAETDPKDETKTDLDGAILQSKVYFAFDGAELDDEGRATLAEAAVWFKDHPEPSVVIEGHTDLVGDLAPSNAK